MIRRIILLVLGLLILVGAVALGHKILQKPIVPAKKPMDNRVTVETEYVRPANYYATVSAIGKVEASQKIEVFAQVSGAVKFVSKEFLPGGIVKKGALLIKIDDTDYKLAVIEAHSNYLQAKAAYAQALGRSKQAKADLALYQQATGKKIKNQALALRKPDLEQAKANLVKAQAGYLKAKLNLKRTSIYAPFNAIITAANVNLGSMIGAGVSLCSLANTGSYRVNVSLPVSKLKYVRFSKTTVATLSSDEGKVGTAKFLKLANYLDNNTRFMNALFVVDKSEDVASHHKLYLGDYINVAIKGKVLTNVFRLPLSLVRGGYDNKDIVYTVRDGNLDLTPVDLIYQDDKYAYVKGLRKQEQIITSDLALAINHMAVKVVKAS